jgi:hypothetical protein
MSSAPSLPAAAAGAAVETPTVCGDDDVGSLQSSSDEEEDPDPLAELRKRAPTTERIIKQLLTDASVKHIINMIPADYILTEDNEKGEDILLKRELWEIIHQEILEGIFLYSATCKKNVDAFCKNYMHKTFEIDVLASLLHEKFPEDVRQSMTDKDRRTLSLALQLICTKFIDTFHELISYPSQGERLTIAEEVEKKVQLATQGGTTALFPEAKTMNNAYYIIGFLGHQAEKQAKRRAKDSGVQKCLTFIANNRFFVRNRSGSEQVNEIKKLVADQEMPTKLVEEREALGGLHYADRICWEFFSIIEYIYSTLTTPDNFLWRGGKLLREICEAISHNNELVKRFAMLCDHDEKSEFTIDDTTTCFEYFLKVFGRVRAKDVALKYNSAVYKKKNTVALRAQLAALSGQNKKSKNKKSKPAAKKQKTGDGGQSNSTISDKQHHKAIMEDLDKMNEEIANDDNTSKKVSSEVVEEMIAKDTPKD